MQKNNIPKHMYFTAVFYSYGVRITMTIQERKKMELTTCTLCCIATLLSQLPLLNNSISDNNSGPSPFSRNLVHSFAAATIRAKKNLFLSQKPKLVKWIWITIDKDIIAGGSVLVGGGMTRAEAAGEARGQGEGIEFWEGEGWQEGMYVFFQGIKGRHVCLFTGINLLTFEVDVLL